MSFFSTLLEQIASQRFSEWMAVLCAITYLLLATRANPWCWAFGIVSSAFWAYADFTLYKLFIDGGLQIFYIAMGFIGFFQWKYGGEGHSELPVTRLARKWHILILVAGIPLALVVGRLFDVFTSAESTYLNAFTTVFAVVTTFLAVRKKLENWIYWFIIDSLNVVLYWTQGGYLIALLFVAYLVIVVFGFFSWRGKLVIATNLD